jgi:putative peptidoglycan lipid II flippase
VALLPILSKYLKAGDIENARTTQNQAVEYGLLLSLPAAVLLIVLANPIVTFLFRHGAFNAHAAQMTAYAVAAYSVGLPCYVMTKALMPNFFARGDTVTPVKYSFWVFVTNLIFNLLLMRPFGHVGIAVATTIAAFVSLGQYVVGLQKREYWRFTPLLIKKMLKIALASITMGIVVWGANKALCLYLPQYMQSSLYLFCGLAFLGIIALAIFLLMAKILNIIDFRQILNMVRRKHG